MVDVWKRYSQVIKTVRTDGFRKKQIVEVVFFVHSYIAIDMRKYYGKILLFIFDDIKS